METAVQLSSTEMKRKVEKMTEIIYKFDLDAKTTPAARSRAEDCKHPPAEQQIQFG